MLHPRTEVWACNVNELKRGASRIKALFFEQLYCCPWPVKHRENRLAVFDHVAMKFHQLPFFARAHQQHGHASRRRVPNFAPSCIRLVLELTHGHVGNHCRNTHARTKSFGALYAFMPTAVSGAFVRCRLVQPRTSYLPQPHGWCCERGRKTQPSSNRPS